MHSQTHRWARSTPVIYSPWHNGVVIMLLTICGLSQGQACRGIAMVAVVVPVVALIALIALGTAFGSF